jgi:hypothetical protein
VQLSKNFLNTVYKKVKAAKFAVLAKIKAQVTLVKYAHERRTCTVVIGGILSSTVLTFLVLPVFYRYIHAATSGEGE